MNTAYPLEPGFKEGETSREAAEKFGKAQTYREKILDALRDGAQMTADEAAVLMGVNPLSVRPRFSELRQMNLIVPTGQRRKSSTGTSSHVWRAMTLTEMDWIKTLKESH